MPYRLILLLIYFAFFDAPKNIAITVKAIAHQRIYFFIPSHPYITHSINYYLFLFPQPYVNSLLFNLNRLH